MSPPRIVRLDLTPVNLPMRQPFVTALGRKQVSRNLWVQIHLEDGTTGLGEASSSLAWPADNPSAMRQVLSDLADSLIGQPIRPVRALIAKGWEGAGAHPTAAAALECALLDAAARTQKISLWRWCGGSRRFVTTSLTLSAWTPTQMRRAALKAAAGGFQRLKIKVTGRDLDEDLRRVAAVHRAAPHAILWLDGNQGFSAENAVRFAQEIRRRRFPVRLFEQPVPKEDREGLAQVSRDGKIPVAADESARSIQETLALIRRKTAPIINVKMAKAGFLGALRIVRQARLAGIRLMIGCMAESAQGLSASVHLSCGTGAFNYVDLDSHLLLESPPGTSGFQTVGNRLIVETDRPGNGVTVP